jgi:hypothetical protein
MTVERLYLNILLHDLFLNGIVTRPLRLRLMCKTYSFSGIQFGMSERRSRGWEGGYHVVTRFDAVDCIIRNGMRICGEQ